MYPFPQVAIIEEPQSRGFRFRYECEGPSHGGLQGTSSERGRKTYPSIKIENYDGPARIEVSLVNVDNDKNHPHKLVGKNCEDGICVMEVKETYGPIHFQNMSVQHVTKKKAVEVLQKRIKNKLLRDKKIFLRNLNAIVSLSTSEQAKSTQLNNVKLCFQVYVQDSETQQCIIALPPVYSNSIHDSKSPGASTLKICRMDKYGGCCTGNEEVFLLCEKVQKEDIAVKFFELDSQNGEIKWESFGNFGPLDVHRQFAIVFRTPSYFNTNIEKAVNVFIVLQRKSDGETSDPKSFTYYPQNLGKAYSSRSIKIIERTLTAMQDYAETSDIRYLLLVQRHLASVQNKNGDLPIHLAVINDQLPALQSFLGVMSTLPNCNHKVNSFNYLRQTPLHLAVLTKQPSAIELLLHYGADPGIMDRYGNTAANLAVQCNNIPCLKSLLKYLRPGVKATSPFPELNYMNYGGFCPAHIAAQNGNVEILRLLYKGKACLDLPDGKSGRTPLHHAVESDDLSVASYLLMEVS
ncbi:hypothetical protein LOTGIDRAFT_106471 [Lottia gigantea]|uniref:RHD domain-containing protein n=1 Tax=Lottia gigantea TaxID=225164 RepID=V4A239_LOTGI|nr:hypothetical protein LOTGIDRAFT_106471 [Lottia gigantea]ESO88995.1 hypothetical protein LOTGIDRAFT_106471 [Lottia gigantea]